jgi:integrase
MDQYPKGIRPAGKGLRIRIWKHGKLAHSEIVPGNLGKAHVAAAVKRRADLAATVRLGISLHENDRGVKSFAMVAQEYLSSLEAKRSTSLSYENILNRYWLPAFERWPVNRISTSDIKTVLSALPVASKTKRNILIPLAGVLTYAECNPNPAKGIKLKRHQKPPVSRYSPAERAALIARLEGQPQAYFALLFATGLRPGEALGLTWADWDGEEISVSKQITRRRKEGSTKTSVRRRVYVPQWARPYINALPSRFAGGHMFVNTKGGAYLDTDVFNEAWQKAHARARIPYRIPYTCRHTRAAELLSAGIDPADAAMELGHSTEMFLRTYSEFMVEYAANKGRSRFDTDKIPTTVFSDAEKT